MSMAHLSPEERKRRKRIYRARYRTKHPGRHNKQVLEWQKRNRDKRHATQKRYREKHVGKRKAYKAKARYGLSQDSWDALLAAHANCQICGSPFDEPGTRKCVDHDHDTGVVRGLLCNSCNGGLGLFRDSTARLMAAIAYLQRHGK